jgi:hypothetical protein
MWAGDEGGPVPLYAHGVAESGEPCSVTVRTFITDPSNAELTSAYGYGSGHAESTVSIYVDENSTQGTYTGKTEGWSQGVYYGCATASAFLEGYASRYFYVGQEQSGQHFHSRQSCYHACQHDSRLTANAYNPYLQEHGLHINFVVLGVCRFTNRAIAMSLGVTECFGPAE